MKATGQFGTHSYQRNILQAQESRLQQLHISSTNIIMHPLSVGRKENHNATCQVYKLGKLDWCDLARLGGKVDEYTVISGSTMRRVAQTPGSV